MTFEDDICIVRVEDWTKEEYYQFLQILKLMYGNRAIVSELSFESILHVDDLDIKMFVDDNNAQRKS